MKLTTGICAVALVASLAGSCLGQNTTTLYLIKTENFDLLSRSEASAGVPNPDNTYWIGHTPSCIAYGSGRLFIGGILNGSTLPLDGADADGDLNTTETTPFSCSIVKVNNILTTRTFSTIPGSRASVANTRGYSGLDYAPNVGATVRGLIANLDTGSGGVNLNSRFNVDVTGSGVRVAPVPDLTVGFRIGNAGPAWDFGPTGMGVDYSPSGALDGVPDGPVVAVIDFGNFGPYGLDPATMNPNFGQTLYELNVNNGPRLAPDNEGQLLWRDLCIDRRNGNIAARSDNTVTFCTRNADGTTTRVDLAPGDPNTQRIVTTLGSFVIGQNIAIMSGFDPAGVGDLLAWNDRAVGSAGQPFASVVKFSKTNRTPATDSGAAVTPTYLNPDNSPATFPDGIGMYDFFWDSNTKILFVLDSGNRNVYFLSAEQPRACCLPSGSCYILNPTACASTDVGGVAGAAGSTCAPNPCAQPTVACCAADGSCTNVDATTCTNGGGTPQASGSTCSPNPCPQPTGACCNGSLCSVTTAGGCTGTFQGAGTSCSPDPCAPSTGACCCGSHCSVTTSAGCTGAGRVFAGNGTACTPYGLTVPCCRGDYNKTGAPPSVQDIFDFLSGYFATDPCADSNDSGAISVQDIFDFLSAYFGGC